MVSRAGSYCREKPECSAPPRNLSAGGYSGQQNNLAKKMNFNTLGWPTSLTDE
jgi:hypothetical protein